MGDIAAAASAHPHFFQDRFAAFENSYLAAGVGFSTGDRSKKTGGSATDGVHRILDIVPQDLHQRTPLVIGSREDVGYVADTLRRMGEG